MVRRELSCTPFDLHGLRSRIQQTTFSIRSWRSTTCLPSDQLGHGLEASVRHRVQQSLRCLRAISRARHHTRHASERFRPHADLVVHVQLARYEHVRGDRHRLERSVHVRPEVHGRAGHCRSVLRSDLFARCQGSNERQLALRRSIRHLRQHEDHGDWLAHG